MPEMKIDISEIENMKALGQTFLMEETFNVMATHLDTGNIIVIERRYNNAPPDLVQEISTKADLKEFISNYL